MGCHCFPQGSHQFLSLLLCPVSIIFIAYRPTAPHLPSLSRHSQAQTSSTKLLNPDKVVLARHAIQQNSLHHNDQHMQCQLRIARSSSVSNVLSQTSRLSHSITLHVDPLQEDEIWERMQCLTMPGSGRCQGQGQEMTTAHAGGPGGARDLLLPAASRQKAGLRACTMPLIAHAFHTLKWTSTSS